MPIYPREKKSEKIFNKKAGVPGKPDYVTAEDVGAMKDVEGKLIYGNTPLKGGKCAVHG